MVANEKPLVSVIMIFLNAEAFIEEAIASVCGQTYHNWELLLVDDGSTDQSTAIALDFVRRCPEKIRYVEHPGHVNRGMSASRNRGLQQAKGAYLAFLDADDVWFAYTLQRQVEALRAHPEAGMVYASAQMWHSWTGDPADIHRDVQRNIGVRAETLFPPRTLLPVFLQRRASTPAMCSLLLRRDVLDQVGGFDEAFRGMLEDQVMITKVCLHAAVFVTADCWSRYRQHPDSTCAHAAQTGAYHPARPSTAQHNYLAWLEQYLREQGIEDEAIWIALRQRLAPYRRRAVRPLSREQAYVVDRIRSTVPAGGPRSWPGRVLQHARARAPQRLVAASGRVRMGSLRRLTPVSDLFGFDRGQPVDRYFIEQFLALHAPDIRGRVLEIGDNAYTRAFGGERVTTSEVLHVADGNPNATIVGDLTDADHVPSNSFDCIVLTQTLHLIYDLHAAIATVHRILKPGGVVLATVPGISQISQDEWSTTWYWSLTSRSSQRLFSEVFAANNVMIGVHGNVLAAAAFLYGLASHELRPDELNYRDPQYEVIITIRAVKPNAAPDRVC